MPNMDAIESEASKYELFFLPYDSVGSVSVAALCFDP